MTPSKSIVRVALETGSSASKEMVARWARVSYEILEELHELLALPDSAETLTFLRFSSRALMTISLVGLVIFPAMLLGEN